MAVWGNVSSRGVAEDAKAAVRAALAMRRELRKLNENWRAQGGEASSPSGSALTMAKRVVGNIGSYEPHERLDPTVIGDAVNLASRLEGLTRIYGVDILLGDAVCDLVRDEFYLRTVARAQVKGKSEPVEVCTLVAARSEPVDPDFLKWLEVYEEGVRKFRDRDFTQAKILFSRFLEFYPDDTSGEDVSRTRARIRTSAARPSMECGRGVQEEIETGNRGFRGSRRMRRRPIPGFYGRLASTPVNRAIRASHQREFLEVAEFAVSA